MKERAGISCITDFTCAAGTNSKASTTEECSGAEVAEHQGTKWSSLTGLPQSDTIGCDALGVTCRSSLRVPSIGFGWGKQKHVGNCTVTRFSQRDCWNQYVEALITLR